MVKNYHFRPYRITKIDFTQNLSHRNLSNFHTVFYIQLLLLHTMIQFSFHYRRPRFKILTLFSCKARERLALMERPDLAGILSFEPRPSQALRPATQHQTSSAQFLLDKNVTEVSYCDQRSLTTLQLARLGQRLSKSGNLNVIYTYR